MNRFPLIRLPYVALREVIISIEKSDLFSLALSSRKTRRLIKTTKNSIQKLSEDVIKGLDAKDKFNLARLETLENSTTLGMDLNLSEQSSLGFRYFCEDDSELLTLPPLLYFKIEINYIGDEIEGKQEIIRFGDLDVPVIIKSKDIICTIWENIEYGFQFMCRHFFQHFKFHRIDLDVDPKGLPSSKFSESLKTAMTILKTPLRDESDLRVENIELMTETDLHLVFHDMKYNNIEIGGPKNGRFPDNFQCEGMGLLVMKSSGFSLKNMLNSKCKNVCLEDTQMTNRVMTKVLKHWLDGKLETLEDLEIALIEDVDIEKILDGLSDRTGHVVNRREELIWIRRRDGKIAALLVGDESETFKMEIE